MRIAAIADIHSNIYALEAVTKDIDIKNIDLIVCLGDLVGYSPFPNEVIKLIRERKIMTVMGNYDEAVGQELMICGCDYPDPKDMENASISLNWTIDNTSEDNKSYLKALPRELKLTYENKSIVFLHGSPRKLTEYLKENSKEADEVMAEFDSDILVCGHTHKPYQKMYGEKMLINAGSVGKPKTGNPNANYIILDIKEEIKFEIVEVAYDYERTAFAIERIGLPAAFSEIIRTGNA